MKLRNLLCGALAPLVLLSGCALTGGSMQTTKPYVAVITKSTSSSFWKSVEAGANAAASEYNLDFTFEGPASEEDWEAQNVLVENAIQNGAKAIVLSAIDYTASSEIVDRAAEQGIVIIVIDSDIDSERVAVRIGTDNYNAGRQSAYALLDADETHFYIGMVGFDVHSENGQARERGFENAAAEDARAEIVEKINCASKSETVQAETRKLLRRHPEINAIVTFNELTTLGVGHAIEELERKDSVRVVGFDNNVVSVGMLETGEIDALIVQNPFAMGYLGLETAAQMLGGKAPASDRIDTEVRAIDQAAMYTEQNQKFLFSFTENQ
ncbi:MAG: substrate-binding domain-containing protein [Eubacteriales bacterium]|nr:substrate-binding domain-containing protein [Eubacteriales bacterium]